MSTRVDAAAFPQMLRDRCMTGEELRRKLRLSPTTLAKFHRGATVSDRVFHKVVLEIQSRPVVPLAQQLAGATVEAGSPTGQESASAHVYRRRVPG
jgi:hypothetical protein